MRTGPLPANERCIPLLKQRLFLVDIIQLRVGIFVFERRMKMCFNLWLDSGSNNTSAVVAKSHWNVKSVRDFHHAKKNAIEISADFHRAPDQLS
mmetsp:Transcript_18389/g.32365  ORF Transcript_18389/g.32365 Transcript_18389/m.32365 type:complete len:94 (+) Transcript_18389:696-977(+)